MQTENYGPKAHPSVWLIVFVAYYESYLLYAMGVVFGPMMFFMNTGWVRWLGLVFFFAGLILIPFQIAWRYRMASKMSFAERQTYHRERLGIQREKEELGI